MVVVRPGMPVMVPRERAGFVSLTWADEDGKAHKQRVIVVKPRVVFDLGK